MNNELKPCPFCGGKDVHIWDISTPWVQCYDCLASTTCRNTQEEAIKYWNMRVEQKND